MNTEKKTFRVHAFLRTSTPLHISSGASGYIDVSTGRASLSKGEAGQNAVPCNMVQQLSFLAPGSEFGVAYMPVIMANNISGRLRRRAAKHVLDAVSSKGQTVQVGTFNALMTGAVSGKPSTEDATFDEYRAASEHPYLGLFGGGPKMMRRRMHLFNAVPYSSISRVAFERARHPFLDDQHAVPSGMEYKLTQSVICNRLDDLRELSNVALASSVVQDFENAIRERQAAIFEEKTKKDSGRTTTRSFTGLQFVIPNVVFPLCWEFKATPAQFGLFLKSLDDFAHTEELGGYGRNGFGRFTLSDVVMTDVDDKLLSQGLFQNNRLVYDQPTVAEAVQAWDVAQKEITGNKLNDLFMGTAKSAAKSEAEA